MNIAAEKKYHIPAPFDNDKFKLLQIGVYDDPQVNVYINEQNDFAFLDPMPNVDYVNYTPRVKKINLTNYKNNDLLNNKRFNKISYLFHRADISSLIEIGAAEGAFLKVIKQEFPNIKLFAVEPDQNTNSLRKEIKNLRHYETLSEVCNSHKIFDVICMFHVLEHILKPASFLDKVRKLMHPDSIIIVEVPSMFDPLLSLFKCESYRRFYFQVQHPFVYSGPSISRLFEHHGFQAIEIINHQRYGLENHLNWLINESPGGDELFKRIFFETNKYYISELERYGKTDSVIWVGKIMG